MSALVRPLVARQSLFAGAVLALLTLSAAPQVAAQDQQANGATIQWAQQILDQQGFYQGRASGKMDSATAAAIAAYQRKNGLKGTGRLDQTTVDHMLNSRPERTGVGNLADPGSRAKASQPIGLREADVKPQAAPVAASVDRAGGTENSFLGVSRGGSEPAPAAVNHPQQAALPQAAVPQTALPVPDANPPPANNNNAEPSAAPRSSVEREVTQPDASAAGGFNPDGLPDWVRYGLMGGIGALLVGMLGFWWGSGRRQVKPAPKPKAKAANRRPAAPAAPAAGNVRREPTLGGPPPGPDGRRDPVFTAPARDTRRL